MAGLEAIGVLRELDASFESEAISNHIGHHDAAWGWPGWQDRDHWDHPNAAEKKATRSARALCGFQGNHVTIQNFSNACYLPLV